MKLAQKNYWPRPSKTARQTKNHLHSGLDTPRSNSSNFFARGHETETKIDVWPSINVKICPFAGR